jgi:hypothetical protein
MLDWFGPLDVLGTVGRLSGTTSDADSYIDLLWKGTILVEMKKSEQEP